jgi:hypothetical protein
MTPSPTGIEIGSASVRNLEATFETLGAGHGDGSDRVIPEVLLHFERQLDGPLRSFALHGQRIIDPGQPVREFDVHHRTDHLNDSAFIHLPTLFVLSVTKLTRAQADSA